MKITEYIVLSASSPGDIAFMVQSKINLGYQPYGYPSIVYKECNNSLCYTQTVVMYG